MPAELRPWRSSGTLLRSCPFASNRCCNDFRPRRSTRRCQQHVAHVAHRTICNNRLKSFWADRPTPVDHAHQAMVLTSQDIRRLRRDRWDNRIAGCRIRHFNNTPARIMERAWAPRRVRRATTYAPAPPELNDKSDEQQHEGPPGECFSAAKLLTNKAGRV